MKKRLLYLLYSLLFFLPAATWAQTASHVVISEIYGAGGNTGAIYNADFIELYNPTSADVDMSGWSVQYNSATGVGAFSGITVFPAGSIIKSHGYFLVSEQGGSVGAALPTADIATSGTTNNFNLSGTAGKVALVSNSTIIPSPPALPVLTIVDFIGFGSTAVNFEGTGPAIAPSATTSIERKVSATSTAATMQSGGLEDLKGNGYDSDNNANDFIVPTTINPQNSASPLEIPPSNPVAGLAVTPTTLDFSNTTTVFTSSVKTFSLSGTNLTGNVTITAVAPYTISKDGTNYSASLTYTTTDVAAAQTVSVKFSPVTTTGTTGTISITSGTATASISVLGTGASAIPTLTASQTALTFGNQAIGTSSTSQSFTISGSSLSTSTAVSVAAPFAISKDGVSYSTLLLYAPGDLATVQTVFVQYNPTVVGSSTGTITVASAGATSKTVALTGTAVAGSSSNSANHVVISELYGAGGNTGAIYNADFIELYNPTSADVDMSGWSVQYNSATGVAAFSGITVFPAGSIIKSHGYFLVSEQGGSVGIALPTADVATSGTTNNFNMSGTAGKIALVNNSTIIPSPPTLPVATIIDFVGYGTTAVNFEGTGPAIAPSATTSIERKVSLASTSATMQAGGSDDGKGNGFDSDNNANDFIVPTTINPQNSASPLETAGGGSVTLIPTLVVTPTSLDFGTTQTINTPSTAKTFTVSGTNLTSGATTTASSLYTISKDNVTFSTSLTFTAAELAVNQTVFVKFTPTNTLPTTGSVAITSTGAVGQGVILTGTGSAIVTPGLTVTPATLAFGNIIASNTSVKTFAISGINLGTNSTTLSVPSPYTLSKDGTTYTASINYTPTELATNQTVSVKFSPIAAGAANSSVTIANTAVTTPPTVTLTGAGIVPTLAVVTNPVTSPTAIDFGTQTVLTSAVKTYTLSGINLTGGTTVAVTGTGYTISRTSATTGFATSLTFTAAELATAQTVWVNFTPAALGSPITGSITNTTTGTGAVNASVSLTGISVAAPVPTLTVSPTALTFSATVNIPAAIQSYVITGANITGATTVTVAAPYSISKTATGTFGTTLSYLATDFPTNTSTQTVYVKFTPTVVAVGGVNNGTALNVTASGGSSQTVTLNGTGIGVPLLTATPTTLTYSTIINTTSVQNFTLSGVYLTALTTVTVAAPYSVSTSATGTFGTSVTYQPTDLATNQTVYVKFSPTAIAAANGSAFIASTGAVSQTITLNGTGLGKPALTATPTTLAFPLQPINTTSANLTYTLSGAFITDATTLTTAAPFKISKDGTTFSTTLSFTIAELASSKTVYVQFAPTAIASSVTGSVVQTTTNGDPVTVNLTGIAVAPLNVAPTFAAITDQNLCYTTAIQTIPITGISAGPASEGTQTVIMSVKSSNPSLFSQLGILPNSSGTSQINYAITNGQTGTAIITVTAQDNGGTANGGTDTFTRTFNITVSSLATIVLSSDAPNNVVEKGNTITLTATGGTTYTWTPATDVITSATGSSITIKPTTVGTKIYTVTATANSCAVPQSISISVVNAKKLITSNVITPNGDGVNDTWVIQNINLYPASTVKVFNKAGKIVYTKAGYANDWNGYYNGQPLPQGTYYYVVDLGGGNPYEGYISIVRD